SKRDLEFGEGEKNPKIMARGKIQIKKIENSTNRQVTYSKRRSGLFKKASELSVLCEAQVSIIMISSTRKLQEYISPGITTKEFFDKYQKASGTDLWSSHFETMKEELKRVREVNRNLVREIRQRMGESLQDLDLTELVALEENLDSSARTINETKVRNLEQIHKTLIHEFVSILYKSFYFNVSCVSKASVLGNGITFKGYGRGGSTVWIIVDDGGDYEAVHGFPN
ncbi:hypothetical protein RJ639_021905, partial [Escallonia herrerae]